MESSKENNSKYLADSVLLVGAAESVWAGGTALVNIQIGVTQKLKLRMQQLGMDSLESVFITDSDIRHIKRSHSDKEETRGQLNVTPEDFATIPEILNDFDSCDYSESDKLGNKKFLLTKEIDNVYYLVTIQRGKKKLAIKTMWKKPGASC